jgi:hypothetical protein
MSTTRTWCLIAILLSAGCDWERDRLPNPCTGHAPVSSDLRRDVPEGTPVDDGLCSVERDGTVRLEYKARGCAPAGWWRGCRFAVGEHHMASFDADSGGHGHWAVRVCVEGTLASELNLWYSGHNSAGAWSKGKSLRLISGEERLSNSCRTIFLSAGDACTLAKACGPTCTANSNGGASTDDPSACLKYERSELTLMAEWCPQAADANDQSQVVVRLTSLRYYPDACSCSDDGECPPTATCHREGWSQKAQCRGDAGESGSCRGVCMP